MSSITCWFKPGSVCQAWYEMQGVSGVWGFLPVFLLRILLIRILCIQECESHKAEKCVHKRSRQEGKQFCRTMLKKWEVGYYVLLFGSSV